VGRIRIFSIGARHVEPRHPEFLSSAVLDRRRLRLRYQGRASGTETERVSSNYRDNWYLGAWRHLREGLRIFAPDTIHDATRLDTQARDIPDAQLDEEISTGYGIFAGCKTETAVLRFTPERARWVENERRHPGHRRTGPNRMAVMSLRFPTRTNASSSWTSSNTARMSRFWPPSAARQSAGAARPGSAPRQRISRLIPRATPGGIRRCQANVEVPRSGPGRAG
jgi:predicted DNA-binding transcriptional regulator YafY